tara:strand:+ start:185 stop:739 length:555 start_codon:yes stop_codon:yes gene_type:complete
MNDNESKLKKDFSEAEREFFKKNYKKSTKLYEIIVNQYPKLTPALHNLGLGYELLELFDKSIFYYKECCKITPNEKTFINKLGNIHFKIREYQKACDEYDKSLNLDFKQVEIIEKFALSLMSLNLRDKANNLLRKGLNFFPDDELLNTIFGRNLLSLNQHQEGLSFLKKGTGFIEIENDLIKII